MRTHAIIATVVLAAFVAAAEEPAADPGGLMARREAALIEQLASPDAAVREEAAYWLHFHRTERAFDALFRVATSDPSESLRENAENWLRYDADCPTDLLVKKAEAAEVAVRRLAVGAIRTYENPKGQQAMLKALGDPDAGVRLASLDKLQSDDLPELLPKVIRLMDSDVDPAVRTSAMWHVRRSVGRLSRDMLIQMLARPNELVRRSAAEEMADPAAEPPAALLAALADPSDWVREGAAEAVGKCKHTAVQADALLAVLHDAAPKVADKAAEGLVGMKDAAVNAKLAALLAGTDLPARTRYAIDRARARTISGVEGARLYVKLLRQGDPDHNWELRQELAQLAKADHGVLPELAAALTDPNVGVREAALQAIQEAGDASMAPHVRRTLAEDASPEVRAAALKVLVRLEGAKAFQTALSLIDDRDDMIAAAAVEALRLTGDPRATDAILAAAASRRDAVRGAALTALQYLADRRALEALVAVMQRKEQDPLILVAEDSFWEHPLIKKGKGKALRDAVLPITQAWMARDGDRVIRALSAVKDDTSEAAILGALTDESLSLDIRIHAAEVLGGWKCASAVPALIAALSAAEQPEEGWHLYFACTAARALALIGDRRAAPALAKLLNVRDWRDRTAEIACQAAMRLDADAAVEVFLAAFGRCPEAARKAMRIATVDRADFGFDVARWRRHWTDNRQGLLDTWKSRCDLWW